VTTTHDTRYALYSHVPWFGEPTLQSRGVDIAIRATEDHLWWQDYLSTTDTQSTSAAISASVLQDIRWNRKEVNCNEVELWLAVLGYSISSRSFSGVSIRLPREIFRTPLDRQLSIEYCIHPVHQLAVSLTITTRVVTEHDDVHLDKSIHSLNQKEWKLPSAVVRVASWGLRGRDVVYGTVIRRTDEWHEVAKIVLWSMLMRCGYPISTVDQSDENRS